MTFHISPSLQTYPNKPDIGQHLPNSAATAVSHPHTHTPYTPTFRTLNKHHTHTPLPLITELWGVWWEYLTYLPLDKMAAILQTIFSEAFL